MSKRFTYDESAFRKLTPRPQRSNKGTFGQLLVVGGSYGMSGAAYLCAKAAYRTGCGMCRILSPEENRTVYQTSLPEAVLTLYDSECPDEKTVKNAVCRASALAVGMGLSTSENAKKLLIYTLESAQCPTVIDADALNLIAQDKSLWKYVPKSAILTPHPLEMSRLTSLPLASILEDIPRISEEFAAEHGVICVLKDSNTAVSDGESTMINTSGNSGLATAGSGDVLAGIIASLLAQGVERFDAASLGVFIHGLAGDFAAASLSEYSVMASDIIDSVPCVMKKAESYIARYQ